MLTEEVFVQQFARLFVHYRDAMSQNPVLASDGPLREWSEIPWADRERIVAAARLAFIEIESSSVMEDESRRYYAKPGEAEWGC